MNKICAQLEELNSIATLNGEGWIIKPGAGIDWPSLSWGPLIKALDKYIASNYDGNIWRQQVGGAQLILPAHVINEYSHPSRPFYPCPTWGDKEEPLPRTGVNDWREAGENSLSRDFAWVRGDWRAREWMDNGHGDNYHDYAQYDRSAVNELLRARVEQVRSVLESKLSSKPHSSAMYMLVSM